MIQRVQNYAPLVGRILLSAIFIGSGLGKIFDFGNTANFMQAAGMPMVTLFLIAAIAMELGGGLSLLLGFRVRLGAVALVAFMLPATFIFHAFWTMPAEQQQLQMIMFMKNWAIIGGLFVVFAFGAGRVSLDNWLACRSSRRDPGGPLASQCART